MLRHASLAALVAFTLLPACGDNKSGPAGGGDDGGTGGKTIACGDTGGLQPGAPWPMEGGCPTHPGRTLQAGPKSGTAKPFATTGDKIHGSAAIAADGTLFVGSADGGVYAFDKSGKQLWTQALGKGVTATPAIAKDGTIVVGALSNEFVGLDPASGSKKWTSADVTGGRIAASASIGGDGTIYVASEDYSFYALDKNGNKKWSFKPAAGAYLNDGMPTLSLDGATVYVTSLNGRFYALAKADGSMKCSPFENNPLTAIDGAASVGADGTVYLASQNDNVYALGPDCSQKWAYTAGDHIESAPSIGADGTIYVGADDGMLYAIDGTSGLKKWTAATGAAIRASATIDGEGTIYVGSDDKNVYALSPDDGSVKWKAALGDKVESAPSIGADGTLYVGCDDGKVYAIGP